MAELNILQKVQVCGFALVAVGCFTPIIEAPIIGGVSLWTRMPEGQIGITICAIGIYFAINGSYKKSEFCARLIGAGLALVYWNVSSFMSDLHADVYKHAIGKFERDVARVAAASVHFSWGCGILLFGYLVGLFSKSISLSGFGYKIPEDVAIAKRRLEVEKRNMDAHAARFRKKV